MNAKTQARTSAELVSGFQQQFKAQQPTLDANQGGYASEAKTQQQEHKAAPLNQKWVERIFEHLLTIYGRKFSMALDGVDIGKAKQIWAKALAGYSADEIKRGLEACLTHKWPPALPDFLEMCRGRVDYDEAFYDAVEQMIRRNNDQSENWPSKAHFWAAARMGARFLEQPYSALKDEWKTRFDKAMEQMRMGMLPDIPKRAPALPPKGEHTVPKEQALKHIQQLKSILSGKGDDLLDEACQNERKSGGVDIF